MSEETSVTRRTAAADLVFSAARSRPDWLTGESAWVGHIPFAMALVASLRPQRLVELGAWRCDSYFAFCQAVVDEGVDTRCTAVDTWRGDEHAGGLARTVLAQVRAHHDTRFAAFSELLRASFDEAVESFEDGSIDLLHIDGFHTYEAARHDFDTWRPKLAADAIVLIHDVCERSEDFGVWRLWEELERSHPAFLFTHAHGLGVVAPGTPPAALSGLFELDDEDRDALRTLFALLGDRLEARAGRPQRARQLRRRLTRRVRGVVRRGH